MSAYITTTYDATVVQKLSHGALAIIRTDTVYGLVTSVKQQEYVERLYRVRPREPHKACIVLVADASQAYGDDKGWLQGAYDVIDTTYPTSIIIDGSDAPAWVRRSGTSLAYRIVTQPALRELLLATGPLLAPSANPPDCVTAHTIEEAQRYYGDRVDVYVDGGDVAYDIRPSRLVRVEAGQVTRLR